MKGKFGVSCAVVAFLVFAGCAQGPYASGEKAFQTGDYAAAETAFRDAIAAGEKVFEAHLYLGRIYGLQGDYAKGVGECKRALDINPDHASAIIFHAVLQQLDGNVSRGSLELDRLLGRGGFRNVALLGSLLNAKDKLNERDKAVRLDLLKNGL